MEELAREYVGVREQERLAKEATARDTLRQAATVNLRLVERMLTLVRANQYPEATDLLTTEVSPATAQWIAALTTLVALQEEDNQFDQRHADQTSSTTRILLFSIATLTTIIALGIAVGLTRSLTRRITPMVRFAGQLALGEFPPPLGLHAQDEIGQLADSLDALQSSFLSVMRQTQRISQGNYTTEITPRSENDELLLAFAHMTAALRQSTEKNQQENWIRTGQTELHERLRGETDLVALAQRALTFLAEYSNAQIGALYLREEDGSLQLVSSYAYTRRKTLANVFRPGEGMVGQAALEKKPIVVTNVPDDYVMIASGVGESLPRSLAVIPLIDLDVVEGVLELGSFHPFTEASLTLFSHVTGMLASVLNSARSRKRIEALLKTTQTQTEELRTQQEELRATNDQLEEQTRSLQTSEARLKEQQAELQQTNEELEEKSELLTQQNIEVARKHAEVEHARQALEEKATQLALTSKYKSEFLANMSHELRTPLNSLLILSQQLAENADANLTDKQVQFSQTIHRAGTDLLTLINDILDLAKIESGTVTLDVREVPLSDIRADLLRMFQPIADKKQVALAIDVDPRLPQTIMTDNTRVQQILKNLLANAFKFTATGQVHVHIGLATEGWTPEMTTLARAPHVIAFTVQDTGVGISVENQHVIFEAFQQADGSTSRKYGGTGLGLTISRELATRLGGDLRLMRSAPGAGSTFTLFLPIPLIADLGLRNAEKSSPQSPLVNPQWEVPQSAIRNPQWEVPQLAEVADDRDNIQPGDRVLLIIEDEADFARILLDRARQLDFKGIVALQGLEGLRLAQQFKPAAITLDLGLPDVDGWVVLDRLKVDPTTRHIPVHIISAGAEQARGLQHGAFAYLTKPTTREVLEAAFTRMSHFLERRVRHLLVVEDDDVQRLSILELIGNGDVICTAVGSGSEALTLLDTQPFDCMVLDLRLPDMSGLQLLEEIQRKLHLRGLPVIVYTGKELTRDEERQLQRFTQTIIIKDVRSPERLLDETALFLHRVASNLPEPKRRMIERLYQTDSVLAGKKILVVDDDVRNLFALTALLEGHHIEVETAESGKAALKALATTPSIHAVLMDIMMPEMDGYEAMRAIRQQPQWRGLPIIALTAKAMKGDREQCLEAGASDYITKPVNSEQLLSLLRVWLYR